MIAAAFTRWPSLMNGTSGATLGAIGDALAQTWERPHPDRNRFDWWRCVSSAIIGGTFGSMIYPFAYAKLDGLWPGTSVRSVVQKALAECATVGLIGNAASLGARALLAGRTIDDIARHVAREMPSVTRNDAMMWLPYNLLAFSVIPPVFRPATTALMEAVWQTYISVRANDYDAARRLSRRGSIVDVASVKSVRQQSAQAFLNAKG